MCRIADWTVRKNWNSYQQHLVCVTLNYTNKKYPAVTSAVFVLGITQQFTDNTPSYHHTITDIVLISDT